MKNRKYYNIYDKKQMKYISNSIFASKPTTYINKYKNEFRNGDYELHIFELNLIEKQLLNEEN